MEKGSMRLEANISLRKGQSSSLLAGQAKDKRLPDYKVELKNINSFRFLKQAILFEVGRQSEILERGERVVQETRGYDEDRGVTFSQRGKEGEADYRYFPEPDIPAMEFSDEEIEGWRKELPELPRQVAERWRKDWKVREDYISVLLDTRELVNYFEEAVAVGKGRELSAEKIAGIIVNKKVNIDEVLPAKLVEILLMEKEVFSEEELARTVEEVLAENEKAVADYKKGKQGAVMFLVGQVMARTKGQAEAGKVRERLEKLLG